MLSQETSSTLHFSGVAPLDLKNTIIRVSQKGFHQENANSISQQEQQDKITMAK
jgi:hypothetical protein